MDLAARGLTRCELLGVGLVGAAAVVVNRPPLAWGATATAARWRQLPAGTAPTARSDHGLAFSSDERVVYLYGGRRGGQPLGDLWALDLRTGAWRKLETSGDEPPARSAAITFYDERRRRLVVALGKGGNDLPLADVWEFDVATGAWRELHDASGSGPEGRYGAGGGYDRAGDRLLVSHGRASGRDLDDTWAFDLGSESWRRVQTHGPTPMSRGFVHGVWDAGSHRLLLFGGQRDGDRYLGDLWALDPRRGTWRQVQQPRSPQPRALYGAAADERKRRWFVFGGATAGDPAGDLWVYRSALRFWSRVALVGPRPSPRQATELVVAADRIVLFGGHDGRRELADTWMLPLLTVA